MQWASLDKTDGWEGAGEGETDGRREGWKDGRTDGRTNRRVVGRSGGRAVGRSGGQAGGRRGDFRQCAGVGHSVIADCVPVETIEGTHNGSACSSYDVHECSTSDQCRLTTAAASPPTVHPCQRPCDDQSSHTDHAARIALPILGVAVLGVIATWVHMWRRSR